MLVVDQRLKQVDDEVADLIHFGIVQELVSEGSGILLRSYSPIEVEVYLLCVVYHVFHSVAQTGSHESSQDRDAIVLSANAISQILASVSGVVSLKDTVCRR